MFKAIIVILQCEKKFCNCYEFNSPNARYLSLILWTMTKSLVPKLKMKCIKTINTCSVWSFFQSECALLQWNTMAAQQLVFHKSLHVILQIVHQYEQYSAYQSPLSLMGSAKEKGIFLNRAWLFFCCFKK